MTDRPRRAAGPCRCSRQEGSAPGPRVCCPPPGRTARTLSRWPAGQARGRSGARAVCRPGMGGFRDPSLRPANGSHPVSRGRHHGQTLRDGPTLRRRHRTLRPDEGAAVHRRDRRRARPDGPDATGPAARAVATEVRPGDGGPRDAGARGRRVRGRTRRGRAAGGQALRPDAGGARRPARGQGPYRHRCLPALCAVGRVDVHPGATSWGQPAR